MLYVSDRDREIVEITNCIFINSIFCVVGTVANCINIIVFYKQGFKNTVNISLFALAISDLFSLVTLLWINICVNPWFAKVDLPMVPSEVQYLTGSLPHICFVRITGWITVYITAERCLCITFPLKIRQLVTRKRTLLTIVAIYGLILGTFLLESASCTIDWKFYPKVNRTLLGLAYRSNRKSMEGFIYVLYSSTGFGSFIAVIVFTIILVVQLRRKSKWRTKASLDTTAMEASSMRDRRTMIMVAVIATVLIICYTPGVITSIIPIVEPLFSVVGIYMNAFFVSWSYTFLFEGINSTINIFIYYYMGTKYRTVFHQIFGTCRVQTPES